MVARGSPVGPRLIDRDDTQTAYRVVRDTAVPANRYYRAENTTSWPAGSPSAFSRSGRCAKAFHHVDEGSADPVCWRVLPQWRGRAAESGDRLEDMHAQYATAARYPPPITANWRGPDLA